MAQSDFKIYSSTSEAWKGMYEAILGAQKSIFWEVYTFVDDSVGNLFFELLKKKANDGIKVKIIVDYWGSFWLSNKKIEDLKKNGIDIRLFSDRKLKSFLWWGVLFFRTHKKILVIDEQIGFIGGVNVHKSMENWLDIHVRVEGKIVRSLLRLFARSYITCGGDKKEVYNLLAYKSRIAKSELNLVYDSPDLKKSHVKRKYTEALLKARERVILFSPYYFPDKEFLLALWSARKRGVKIDMLIPLRSDLRLASYVAYFWFSVMHRYGISVHVMKRMMHGKGVVMDDDWAMIGSSNIDLPSFYYNHEANLQFKDKKMIKNLKDIMDGWIKNSEKFDMGKWKKNGYWKKFKVWVSFKIYKFWLGVKE